MSSSSPASTGWHAAHATCSTSSIPSLRQARPSAQSATRGAIRPHRTGGSCSLSSAGLAEFERELIRERTGEGRKRAMAAGVKFGRKPKLSQYQRAEAIKRRAAGETLAEIARSYAVDISTISRLPG